MSQCKSECPLGQYCHDETLKDLALAKKIQKGLDDALENFDKGYIAMAEKSLKGGPDLLKEMVKRLERKHITASGRD